jgi:hypothetical protein
MVQEPRRVRSAPHHLRYSAKNDVMLIIHRTYVFAGLASPCGPGCWLRSSPASGSSPSRAAIPDAKRRVPERVQLLIRSEAASHILRVRLYP